MSDSMISSYLITYLKDYLTNPIRSVNYGIQTLYKNITNAVQLQQNILQLCKLESKRMGLFINYSHAAAKRILQQLESSSLFNLPIPRFTLKIRENLNTHHSSISLN